jgi:hypothetical protein
LIVRTDGPRCGWAPLFASLLCLAFDPRFESARKLPLLIAWFLIGAAQHGHRGKLWWSMLITGRPIDCGILRFPIWAKGVYPWRLLADQAIAAHELSCHHPGGFGPSSASWAFAWSATLSPPLDRSGLGAIRAPTPCPCGRAGKHATTEIISRNCSRHATGLPRKL